MSESLGDIMAGVMPYMKPALCPKCGGRLKAHVTAYLNVPVEVEIFPNIGSGEKRVARYGRPVLQSMREIEEEINREYGDGRVDERDELYCENYHVKDGCDYWCRPDDLEYPED